MKIRGLFAGLLLAVVVTGCTGSPSLPDARNTSAAFEDTPPPPPDTTTNRSGGTMGSGN